MKRLSFHIIFVFCLLYATKGKSQQDITVSQYMFNQLFLNPAYAGTHAYWESSALYRTQWVGWEGSPTSQLIAVDGPILPSLLGIGATIVHDEIGISNSISANIDLSYQLKLDRAGDHRLSFGMKTGFQSQRAYIKDLIYIDQNDPLYNSSEIITQNTIVFGAGLYYYSSNMYFGLAAPLLFAKDLSDVPTEETTRNSYLKNQFYLNGGMVFPLSSKIDFKPSFLLKYTHAAPLQADISVNFLFNKIFWAGLTYRSENMLVFIVEVNATRWMRFGYAYDLNLGEISTYSSGSHEIMLSIDFGKTIVKSSSPRYF
jgi:type IX secretion system PorP/SprF family membrane protein